MDLTDITVNAYYGPVNATFTGRVQVDKLPPQTVIVTLEAHVNTSWSISIEPAQMTFTSSGYQNFTCTVIVPQGTPRTTAQVLVNGTGRTTVFIVKSNCNSTLKVEGPAYPYPSGNTTSNSTQNQTLPGNGNSTSNSSAVNGGDYLLGLSKERFMLVAASAAVIVIAVAIVAFVRSRRKGAVEVVEVVEDEP
jgi:hypothetical protein